MRIEFIGTGNAHGTPTPGCGCRVCREAQINLERRRRAPCLVVSTTDDSASLIVDAGDPVINTHLERPQTIAVLLSHFHALLAHRRSHGSIPLFCPPDRRGLEKIAANADAFDIQEPTAFDAFDIGPFKVTPVLLNHELITFGYCIEADGDRLAYLCDSCGLPPQTTQFLADWKADALAIDCNQHPKSPKPSHNTPQQALRIHRSTGAARSFLTHLSCRVDAWLSPKPKSFPKNVDIARDGMVVDLSSSKKTEKNRAYV